MAVHAVLALIASSLNAVPVVGGGSQASATFTVLSRWPANEHIRALDTVGGIALRDPVTRSSSRSSELPPGSYGLPGPKLGQFGLPDMGWRNIPVVPLPNGQPNPWGHDGDVTQPYAISADGKFVVGSSSCYGSIPCSFIYEIGKGSRLLRSEPTAGQDYYGPDPGSLDPSKLQHRLLYSGLTAACGVSADGKYVVGTGNELLPDGQLPPGTCGSRGFIWSSDGTLEFLGLGLTGGTSTALQVSSDGKVVAGEHSPPTDNVNVSVRAQAWIWVRGIGQALLPDLSDGNSDTHVRDMSSDGSTIIGYANTRRTKEGYRWTKEGGTERIGSFPGGGGHSDPFAVSADGKVIVGYSPSEDGNCAFIWTPDFGMRSLSEVLRQYGLGESLQGIKLQAALAVSEDGRTIMGDGFDRQGKHMIWKATIPIQRIIDFIVELKSSAIVAQGEPVVHLITLTSDGHPMVGQQVLIYDQIAGACLTERTDSSGQIRHVSNTGSTTEPGFKHFVFQYEQEKKGTVVNVRTLDWHLPGYEYEPLEGMGIALGERQRWDDLAMGATQAVTGTPLRPDVKTVAKFLADAGVTAENSWLGNPVNRGSWQLTHFVCQDRVSTFTMGVPCMVGIYYVTSRIARETIKEALKRALVLAYPSQATFIEENFDRLTLLVSKVSIPDGPGTALDLAALAWDLGDMIVRDVSRLGKFRLVVAGHDFNPNATEAISIWVAEP